MAACILAILFDFSRMNKIWETLISIGNFIKVKIKLIFNFIFQKFLYNFLHLCAYNVSLYIYTS